MDFLFVHCLASFPEWQLQMESPCTALKPFQFHSQVNWNAVVESIRACNHKMVHLSFTESSELRRCVRVCVRVLWRRRLVRSVITAFPCNSQQVYCRWKLYKVIWKRMSAEKATEGLNEQWWNSYDHTHTHQLIQSTLIHLFAFTKNERKTF